MVLVFAADGNKVVNTVSGLRFCLRSIFSNSVRHAMPPGSLANLAGYWDLTLLFSNQHFFLIGTKI